MSSEIDYKCDFCKKTMVTKSINTEFLGWCLGKKVWTNNLQLNIDGPHICQECVDCIGVAEAKVN